MKEFEPSANFVARVMKAVCAAEAAETTARQPQPAGLERLPFPLARAVLATGGCLLGLFNLLRLWFSVFSPAICQ